AESEALPAGDTLLDYGCGLKPYRSLFAPKFKTYLGADFSSNARADITVGPEGQLPQNDESVDCVLSSQVLEHTKDPQAYLGEARRVLRRGGSLVLSAPGIWVYHPHPFDHWRWTIDGLLCELRQAGFKPVMVQGVFGPESSALQLWQDATFERLPR